MDRAALDVMEANFPHSRNVRSNHGQYQFGKNLKDLQSMLKLSYFPFNVSFTITDTRVYINTNICANAYTNTNTYNYTYNNILIIHL